MEKSWNWIPDTLTWVGRDLSSSLIPVAKTFSIVTVFIILIRIAIKFLKSLHGHILRCYRNVYNRMTPCCFYYHFFSLKVTGFTGCSVFQLCIAEIICICAIKFFICVQSYLYFYTNKAYLTNCSVPWIFHLAIHFRVFFFFNIYK